MLGQKIGLYVGNVDVGRSISGAGKYKALAYVLRLALFLCEPAYNIDKVTDASFGGMF